MITKSHDRIGFTAPANVPQDDKLTLEYAVINYGHLLKIGRFTFKELASKIEQYYNPLVAKNAECIRVLRKVHSLNP